MQEHINDYHFFPISTIIIHIYLSLKLMGCCRQKWCMLNNMEVYTVPPLNFPLMVNNILFSFPIYVHVTHVRDEIIFLRNVLLFWIKSKQLNSGLCSPKRDQQYTILSFTFTLAL